MPEPRLWMLLTRDLGVATSPESFRTLRLLTGVATSVAVKKNIYGEEKPWFSTLNY
jgi:hypothetical protein